MSKQLPGIHHVTAIAGDPQRNIDFYTDVLGLRLVKQTINYDDPGTYHFYYGDTVGSPGTLLTFFPWPGAQRGRVGVGQASATAFSVPQASLGYWIERLVRLGVPFTGPSTRFGEQTLAFTDTDAMPLEIIAHKGEQTGGGWDGGDIPSEHAIRGIHSVTLSVADSAPTIALLTGALGFRQIGAENGRQRFEAGNGSGAGAQVDILHQPGGPRGAMGTGVVHHIAWRTPDDAAQKEWQESLTAAGVGVTEVMDRQYFHSIYFREPGGVLYEIATDQPGFLVDETAETLGSTLRLPQWLEPERRRIEEALPPVHVPQTVGLEA